MRKKMIGIKVSEEEDIQLKREAERTNKSLSHVCRDRIFNQSPALKSKILERKIDTLQVDSNKFFYELFSQLNDHFSKNEKYLHCINQLVFDLFADMLGILNYVIKKENSNISKEFLKSKLLDPQKYLTDKLKNITSNSERRGK